MSTGILLCAPGSIVSVSDNNNGSAVYNTTDYPSCFHVYLKTGDRLGNTGIYMS